MRFLRHGIICLFISMVLFQSYDNLAYGFWGGQKYKSQIREAYIGEQIVIRPQENKIHAGFGIFSLGGFHYLKRLDKVFFQDYVIKVEIKKIDFKNETITIKLFHPKYGFGEIQFFFDEDQYENLDVGKFREVLEASLSRVELSDVIVNKETGKYHLPSCNHLPPDDVAETVKREQAEKNGIKPCGFCFKHFIYLPDYQLEQSLARKMSAGLRYYSPILNNNAEKRALARVGEKVLNAWPVKLLGFDYSFVLIESLEVNAFSLPAGQIFVTTALYNSLENPLELEAILAHEIAHVERRHTLKAFRRLQQVQQSQAFIAAMGGAAAGVAYSRGNYNAASSSLAISVAVMMLAEITNSGYSKKYEQEADLFTNLYFDQNGLDKKWLSSVFKKMQFVNLCNIANPDPKNHTHPYLRERIAAVANTKFRMLNGDILFCSKKKLKNLYIDPIFLSESKEKTKLFVFIDDRSFVSKKMHDYDVENIYLQIKVGTKPIKFKYSKRDTVFNEFGAILTFTYGNKKNLKIDEFSHAKLVIVESSSQNSFGVEKPYEFSQ